MSLPAPSLPIIVPFTHLKTGLVFKTLLLYLKIMRLSKNRQQHGFTIIEVMIVLAIAGLILLMVFLVVPALQRAARNTQRKNDAAQISAAITNYEVNYASAPKKLAVDPNPNTVDICGTTCSESISVSLGFYKPTVVDLVGSDYPNCVGTGDCAAVEIHNPPDAAAYKDTDTEEIIVEVGRGCDSTNTALGATSDTRSYAILYALETGSTPGSHCTQQ
jgi:prepilin-type N-terminal cleavage/methylation domain-containing protein